MFRTLASLIMLLSLCAHADDVMICYNYGCAASRTARYSEAQLADEAALSRGVFNGAEERAAFAKAVGSFARYAGEQTPIWRDKARDDDGGVDGRMDSIDHSENTTAYLKILENWGFLKLHRVQPRVVRGATKPQCATCIVEIRTEKQYAVDSGWFDNGKPVAVFPLEAWLKGPQSDG